MVVHPCVLPDEPLKVWEGQSEAACIAVQQKAHTIAETGSSGPKMPKTAGRRKHRAIPIGPTVLELARQDREERRADAGPGVGTSPLSVMTPILAG